MKILYVINSLDAGGAEQLLCNFLEKISLIHTENEYSLLLLNKKNKIVNIEFFKKIGVTLYTLNSSVYSPFNVVKIRRFFKDNAYDVVHVHLFPSQYWVALATHLSSSKAKLVFTEHSNKNKRINNNFFKFIEGKIYSKYDRIVAITPNIGRRLKQWTETGAERISVIPNGVDLENFKNANFLKEFLDYKKGGKKIVLMVARFAAPKLQRLLIKSVGYLGQECLIVLVGEGPQLDEARTLVHKLGYTNRVKFLGLRKDIPELMRSADINVLCSEFEGMSGVTLEAMASETPFIGSDVPGINDIVGTDLSLFPNEEQQIAKKILEVFSNKQMKDIIIRENLRSVSNFSIEGMVEKYVELYKTLVGEFSKQI